MPKRTHKTIDCKQQSTAQVIEQIKSVNTQQLTLRDLGHRTSQDLAAILQSIPEHVSILNLSCNRLGFLEASTLKIGFAAIPSTISSLDLSSNSLFNELSKLSKDDLTSILSTIPSTVNKLNLGSNELNHSSGDTLQAAFAALDSIIELDLSFNNLGLLRDNAFSTALSKLPSSVATLNLGYNELRHLPANELQFALMKMTELNSLSLSGNKLSSMPNDELTSALVALSPSVSTLNLGANFNADKTDNAFFINICRAIPNSITTLILDHNYMGRLSLKTWQAIFSTMTTITTLSLANNRFSALGLKEDDELTATFSALPDSITTLNLSSNKIRGTKLACIIRALTSVNTLLLQSNSIFEARESDLVNIFSALTSVCTLDLSDNDLGTNRPEEKTLTHKHIPNCVTTLDLSNNQLDRLTDDAIKTLMQSIPDHIRAIKLDKHEVKDEMLNVAFLASSKHQPMEPCATLEQRCLFALFQPSQAPLEPNTHNRNLAAI